MGGKIIQALAANTDPTRTTSLRAAFASDIKKRFRNIRGVIRKALVDDDVFGLQVPTGRIATFAESPGKLAFDFPTSKAKVDAFMAWLREQASGEVLEIIPGQQLGVGIREEWTNKYIKSAYQRGIYRARAAMIQKGYKVPTIEASGGIGVAFNQPFHLDRVGLLYTRVFEGLKGITDAMSLQVSQILSQGMADGLGPRELARLLNKAIRGAGGDLAITDTLGRAISAERRAVMLARTEIIRAHHSATIQEYRNWRVSGVSVKAELRTAGDNRVCQECVALEGNVYTLEEAESIIPVHPGCRCIMLPLRAGEKPLPSQFPLK